MTAAHDVIIESRVPRRIEWRYVGLGLFAIPWILLPFWMVFVNSLKSEGEASQLSAAWPTTWAAAENFATVLDQGTYLVGLRNSLVIAVPTILAILLLGSMAAWTYARSSSFSLRFAYFATILSIVLPPAIIPTLFVLQKFSLDGERLGYILVLIATRLGIVVFLTTGFIRVIPRDMEEAAELDGASHWQIYRHVILPMIAPVLVVSCVILIINVWNDFYYALFMLQGASNNTLPLTLYQFASNSMTTVRWNLVFAHVLLTSLPLIVAYIFLQRRVVAGLTEGGVKG